MASDDELKDEELVDFEGSDYDIDGDYEEVEEVEDEAEEKKVVAQQPPDLVRGEHHNQSDAVALLLGCNGASATSRNSAVGSWKSVESSAFGCSEHVKLTASVASETLKDLQNEALKASEAVEPEERGASRASQSQEASGSTIVGSIHVVRSPQKASGITYEVSGRVDAVAQSTNEESLCSKQLENGGGVMEIEESTASETQRDAKAISGPAPSMRSDASGAHCTSELVEGRPALPSINPDLEDGELDETAAPQNYDLVAEEEVNDEIFMREKKRRKDGSDMERDLVRTEGIVIKQMKETGDLSGKQHHILGSDKSMEHFAGLTEGRSMGFRMFGLGQGSLAPGIMGPGRPLMPIGIGSLAQGLNAFGGITPHGRPQVHLQEVLAQEHLLRAHALQLAQETLANAMRSPLTRPLGAAAFQPFIGFDAPGPRSHAPKHFPRPPPDLLMGHMGSFARGQRPNLPAGRAGVPGKVGGHPDGNLYNAMGRPFGWSAASGPNDVHNLKWGHGRGRGCRTGLWGDGTDSFGPMPGVLGSAGHARAMMNAALPISMRHLNPDDTIFYQTSPSALQVENDLLHNGFDARWKIEKERMLRNGFPHLRGPDNAIVGGSSSEGCREPEKDCTKAKEVKLPRLQDSSKTGSLAARLGPPAQARVATSNIADKAEAVVTSNVIKLLQPVRKSRILTVSGLPDDTPISTVVEVFEKLGKITDFKKSTKGDTFTISYSSETEAVTAKRNLHRTCLAGKQITVDYAHQ